MIVQVLDKDWEVKPIDNKTLNKLYARFMSVTPEGNEKGELLREPTSQEKEAQYEIAFDFLELSGVEQPDSMVERLILAMAVLNHYLGFDKKKQSNAESPDG